MSDPKVKLSSKHVCSLNVFKGKGYVHIFNNNKGTNISMNTKEFKVLMKRSPKILEYLDKKLKKNKEKHKKKIEDDDYDDGDDDDESVPVMKKSKKMRHIKKMMQDMSDKSQDMEFYSSD